MDLNSVVNNLRRTFNDGKTTPLEWRIQQLRNISLMLQENIEEWEKALYHDLGLEPGGSMTSFQIGMCLNEIDTMLDNLKSWVRPVHKSVPLFLYPSKAELVYEPLGVVLIIGPWNYPIQLMLMPLIGAIAAGNACVLKPSEVAPHTSTTVARLIPKYLDTNAVTVIEGGVDVTTELLKIKFDHIFYTGSGIVGKIILRAAAEHLTPTTLELGGKSPCIVDKSADLEITARRIVWGKFMNCGQTCVAPDYVLVVPSVEQQLIEKLKKYVTQFYGEDPFKSKDYSRIINERHFNRITALMDASKDKAELVIGGVVNSKHNYISPTIYRNVSADSPLMQDELFAPILPILTVGSVQEAVEFVRRKPKPLVIYLFSSDKKQQRYVVERTSSGGVCINDVIVHMSNNNIPFGGVGESGLGRYHGHNSFLTFSHPKSVLTRYSIADVSFRYPPFDERKIATLNRFMRLKVRPKIILLGVALLVASIFGANFLRKRYFKLL